MKLIFSLCFLVISSTSKAQLIKIDYIFNKDAAIAVAKIFEKQYSVPKSLIKISKKINCDHSEAQFCLDEFNRLKMKLQNHKDFKKSLSSFEIKKEVSYDY